MTQDKPEDAGSLTPGNDVELEGPGRADGGRAAAERAAWCCAWVAARVGWLLRQRRVSREDAEDVCQEVVLAAVRALERRKGTARDGLPPRRLRALLNRVVIVRVHNALRDRRRAEGHYDRTVRATEVLDTLSDLSTTHWLAAKPGAGVDPVLALLRQEDVEALRRAVEELDAGYRFIWEQSVAGQTLAEIAEALGVSSATVCRWRQDTLAFLAARVGEAPG